MSSSKQNPKASKPDAQNAISQKFICYDVLYFYLSYLACGVYK